MYRIRLSTSSGDGGCFLGSATTDILADMLHHLDYRSKGKWLGGRQFGQDFAIQLDGVGPGLVEVSHEPAVTVRILSYAGRNALNPQFGILPTFAFAISKGVLPRFLQTTNGHPKAVLGSTPKALGVS